METESAAFESRSFADAHESQLGPEEAWHAYDDGCNAFEEADGSPASAIRPARTPLPIPLTRRPRWPTAVGQPSRPIPTSFRQGWSCFIRRLAWPNHRAERRRSGRKATIDFQPPPAASGCCWPRAGCTGGSIEDRESLVPTLRVGTQFFDAPASREVPTDVAH